MKAKPNTKAQEQLWAEYIPYGFDVLAKIGGRAVEISLQIRKSDKALCLIRRVDGNVVDETRKLNPDSSIYYIERRARLAGKHRYDRKTAYANVPIDRLGLPSMTLKEALMVSGFDSLDKQEREGFGRFPTRKTVIKRLRETFNSPEAVAYRAQLSALYD